MRTPTSRRRRPHIAGGSPVWLFDLDNTLHHASHAIFPAINQGMTQYIIDALQVDIDEANRLRTGYTQRYGATLLGLLVRRRIRLSSRLMTHARSSATPGTSARSMAMAASTAW